MNRLLLLALTAGLLSPLTAKASNFFQLISRVNEFTDQKFCWGASKRTNDYLRHDGFLDMALKESYVTQYRYRIDKDPPSEFIKLIKGGGRYYTTNTAFYKENYPSEPVDNYRHAGYLIDVRNLPEGEEIRYEFSNTSNDKKVTRTFLISSIKSTLAELKDCPKPKSY